MLENLLDQLKSLDGVEIEIRAEGEYPTKARTPVQHVAKYQNDGTEKIKPAKFVEAAAERNGDWERLVFLAADKYMDGDEGELEKAGLGIAKDINDAVNRIKTGRLKKSFRPKVKK